jgi:serine/threonine protein kinase
MMRENPYRAAGTFVGDSYVERRADEELRQEIEANQRYPYIVAARQSGKSTLTDFDIADIQFVTTAEGVGGLGTPVFAAPEQLEDAANSTELSDVYGLGRLLYFLLLERSPGIQVEADPSLDNLRRFPTPLVSVVRRATQVDPAELERHETRWARVRAQAQRAWRWANRSRLALAMFTMMTIGLVLQWGVATRERARLNELTALIAQYEELRSRFDELEAKRNDVDKDMALNVSMLRELSDLDTTTVSPEERKSILSRMKRINVQLARDAARQQDLKKEISDVEHQTKSITARSSELRQRSSSPALWR